MRANYHTHCSFCDGQVPPAEMAAAAARAGYRVLGFSSHAPLPWSTTWNMPAGRLDAYVAEVRRLTAFWRPRGLEVLLGLECDWIEGTASPADPALDRLGLDYRMGSVHYVCLDGAEPFTVDEGPDEFAAHVRAVGEARRVWQEYYRNLSALIAAGGFDILGHFDLVRRNNVDQRYFDEESRDYLDAALGAAALLEGKDIVVEINLGGVLRGKVATPYPSVAVLRELRARRVPITFCSDAHAPAHLGVHLEDARQAARAAGYDGVAVLSGGRWTTVGIDET